MNKSLLSVYGLKWNPFSPELPVEALHVSAQVENFCWRIEQQLIGDGGFAMISGKANRATYDPARYPEYEALR